MYYMAVHQRHSYVSAAHWPPGHTKHTVNHKRAFAHSFRLFAGLTSQLQVPRPAAVSPRLRDGGGCTPCIGVVERIAAAEAIAWTAR
jgi:hypothetical protein